MSVYPTGTDSFSTKVDDVDDVLAADVNALQSSIVAIETTIGVSGSYYFAGSGTDVITTKGDLIVGNASGDPSRLAAGTHGQVFVVDSGASAGVRYGNLQAFQIASQQHHDFSFGEYISPSFNTGGGTLLINSSLAMNGDVSAGLQYRVNVDNTLIGLIGSNNLSSIPAFVGGQLVATGISAGAHTIKIELIAGQPGSTGFDPLSISLLEIPI